VAIDARAVLSQEESKSHQLFWSSSQPADIFGEE